VGGGGTTGVPGIQTGSTGGASGVGAAAAACAGEFPVALREVLRSLSAAALAGFPLGSGFMMLTGGIDAALGKSTSAFRRVGAPGAAGWPVASAPVAGGTASASGTSFGCPQSGK
jgi:hypothetical protein